MNLDGYKSTCCKADIKEAAPGGVKTKHWLGFECANCGNRSPLSMPDLMKVLKINKDTNGNEVPF